VPSGVRLLAVLVQGAWGGGWGGGSGHYVSTVGQNGAAWQGLLPGTPRQTLYVEVGAERQGERQRNLRRRGRLAQSGGSGSRLRRGSGRHPPRTVSIRRGSPPASVFRRR